MALSQHTFTVYGADKNEIRNALKELKNKGIVHSFSYRGLSASAFIGEDNMEKYFRSTIEQLEKATAQTIPYAYENGYGKLIADSSVDYSSIVEEIRKQLCKSVLDGDK